VVIKMAGELINTDGLGTALVYIADKIGITVAQMYDIYVKAQAAMAIVQIIMILLWVVVVSIVAIFVYSNFKKDNKDDMFAVITVTLMSTIIIGIVLAGVLAFLYNPIIAYMCPEYMALKSLMSDISHIATILK
jgi:hypothetical protein